MTRVSGRRRQGKVQAAKTRSGVNVAVVTGVWCGDMTVVGAGDAAAFDSTCHNATAHPTLKTRYCAMSRGRALEQSNVEPSSRLFRPRVWSHNGFEHGETVTWHMTTEQQHLTELRRRTSKPSHSPLLSRVSAKKDTDRAVETLTVSSCQLYTRPCRRRLQLKEFLSSLHPPASQCNALAVLPRHPPSALLLQ